MDSRKAGFLMGLLGVMMFSAKAVMVKKAYAFEIDSVSLLLLRMLFALPIYLVLATIQFAKQVPKVNSLDYVWLFFFGFIGYYLASYFDFQGLVYIKAGLERIILFVYPTLVIVFSAVIFRTKITKVQLMAIVVTYLGIMIAYAGELDFSGENGLKGAGLIFMSAICYAGYLVGSGWLIPKFGASIFTSLAMIVSCLCVTVHYFLNSSESLWCYPMEVYILGIFMAIVSTVIPSYLISAAIKVIGAPSFSIIGSVGPVSTIILAYFIIGESFSVWQGVGTALVIIGVWLVSKK